MISRTVWFGGLFAVVGLALAWFSLTRVGHAEGRLQDLGAATSAYAVNSAGVVVGECNGQACLWSPDGTVRKLTGNTAGWCCAYAINRGGHVVGVAHGRAFLWTPSRGLHMLDTPNCIQSCACGINEAGQIIGWMRDRQGKSLAVEWTAAGIPCILWPGAAVAITGNHHIVGNLVEHTGQLHPCLLAPGNSGLRLTTRPMCEGEAFAGNDADQVVGTTAEAQCPQQTFLWSPAYGTRTLFVPGCANSYPQGINTAGLVVLNGFDARHRSHAYLWSSAHGLCEISAVRTTTIGSPAASTTRARWWGCCRHRTISTPAMAFCGHRKIKSEG